MAYPEALQTFAGLQAGDQLAVATPDGVTAEYSEQNGVLTLTGTMDRDSLEKLLRNLTFDSSLDRPVLGERIINISVSDGDLSDTRNILVDVTASGSVLVDVTDGLLSFTESDDPLTVDPDVLVEPGPNATSDQVSEASVRFASGYVAGQDVLEFDATTGISFNFDATSGTLTLVATASEGTAAASVFQSALRSVRYVNTATRFMLTV